LLSMEYDEVWAWRSMSMTRQFPIGPTGKSRRRVGSSDPLSGSLLG
jgi:hypothetical protein